MSANDLYAESLYQRERETGIQARTCIEYGKPVECLGLRQSREGPGDYFGSPDVSKNVLFPRWKSMLVAFGKADEEEAEGADGCQQQHPEVAWKWPQDVAEIRI